MEDGACPQTTRHCGERKRVVTTAVQVCSGYPLGVYIGVKGRRAREGGTSCHLNEVEGARRPHSGTLWTHGHSGVSAATDLTRTPSTPRLPRSLWISGWTATRTCLLCRLGLCVEQRARPEPHASVCRSTGQALLTCVCWVGGSVGYMGAEPCGPWAWAGMCATTHANGICVCRVSRACGGGGLPVCVKRYMHAERSARVVYSVSWGQASHVGGRDESVESRVHARLEWNGSRR